MAASTLINRTTQDAMKAAHELREATNKNETVEMNPILLAQDTVLLLEEIYRLQKRIARMRESND